MSLTFLPLHQPAESYSGTALARYAVSAVEHTAESHLAEQSADTHLGTELELRAQYVLVSERSSSLTND